MLAHDVQRYTKTFALARYRARTPAITMQRAERAAADLRASLRAALKACPRRDAMATAVLHSLRRASGCRDQLADTAVVRLGATKPRRTRASKAGARTTSDEGTGDDLDDIGWVTDWALG